MIALRRVKIFRTAVCGSPFGIKRIKLVNSHFASFLQKRLETTELGVGDVALYANNTKEKKADLLAWTGEKPREVCPFGLTPLGICAESGEGTVLSKKSAFFPLRFLR